MDWQMHAIRAHGRRRACKLVPERRMMMYRPCTATLRIAALFATASTCVHAVDGLDTSWNGSGMLTTAMAGYDISSTAMVVQPDGRILLAGSCGGRGEDYTFVTVCMARLLPSGVRDFSFGPNQTGILAFSEFPTYPPRDAAYAMLGSHGLLRQADGKIVIAGYVSTPDGVRAMVTRLLANGALDPAVAAQPVTLEFSHNAVTAQSLILAVAQQADGKLVVAGQTNRAGTNPPNSDFAIARLRADLTLDPSFNGTGIRTVAFDLGGDGADVAGAVAILPDGKILATGATRTASSGVDAALLRLNTDGTRDTSFGNNGAAWFDFGRQLDDLANTVKLDAAGRIWIAGARQFSGSDSDFVVARVRADGSALDTDFCGSGYRSVPFDLDSRKTDAALDLLLQSDGKVVLAGSATTEAGSNFAVARLLPDCNLDTAFGSGGKLLGAFAATMAGSDQTSAAFGGSGIVLGGHASAIDTEGQFGVAQIKLDLIFTNDFER
jgi:uncharacterized delta-60 repeat protein